MTRVLRDAIPPFVVPHSRVVLLIYLLGDKGVTHVILSFVAPHYRVVLLI